MSPAIQQLRMLTRRSKDIDLVLEKHPRHAFITTVLACPLCMGTLMSQLDRRRELDEQGR